MSSQVQNSNEERQFENKKSNNSINESVKSNTKTRSSLSALAKEPRKEPIEPEVAVAAIETLATPPTQSIQNSEEPNAQKEIAFYNEPIKTDSGSEMKAEIIQEISRADTSQLAVVDTTKRKVWWIKR
ncbi:MAG: hypothetical protein IPH33_14280 [Bacteroidetes bacterium]|nr:hypothetical protein [Bacteroidota bacterium]